MISIAIDGPCSSGKSTVADIVANELNIIHLNTGALYRAIGLFLIENSINPKNVEAVKESLNNIDVKVEYINGMQETILNNVNINNKIYSAEVSDICSISSAYPFVREKILNIQRNIAKSQNVVMEGRDITWHVLPNATFKFYIDASAEVRAKRRINDIKSNQKLTYRNVLADIIERDKRDMERKVCPLKRVDDAIYINTDKLTAIETADKILNIINSKGEIR